MGDVCALLYTVAYSLQGEDGRGPRKVRTPVLVHVGAPPGGLPGVKTARDRERPMSLFPCVRVLGLTSGLLGGRLYLDCRSRQTGAAKARGGRRRHLVR